jgi:drug/metabolite transporter (DMT)-like permease
MKIILVRYLVGTVSLWIAVLVTGGPGRVSARGALFFVFAGRIGTVGGRLLRFVSIERVGASIAATLINLNPFVSSTLAIVLLGERVTVPIVVGTAVIVAGTTLLSAGGMRLGFRPGQLLLPLLSAVCFGVVAVLRKLGLRDTGQIVGSAINLTTALVAFTAFLLASRRGGVAAVAASRPGPAAPGDAAPPGSAGHDPCPRRQGRVARHIFLCAPTRMHTQAPLPHDCSKGTITTYKASSRPLQRSSELSIVHIWAVI